MNSTDIKAGLLNAEELAFARKALAEALKAGASKARASLSANLTNLVATLDGEIDKVTHNLDRSLSLALFVDGRYGTFSTNRLSDEDLEDFISKSVDTARALAPDPHRDLPAPERKAKDAVSGLELGIFDSKWHEITPEYRSTLALGTCVTGKQLPVTLLSEEGGYSDSVCDNYLIDSEGLECRHIETSYEYAVQVTIQDSEGNKYSSYWWDSRPFLKDLDIKDCGEIAVRRAAAQIGPRPVKTGKYTMVVENEVASRLLTPVISALSGIAVQQHISFLADSLGKAVFSKNFNVIDLAREEGKSGSRLYDSEGVATTNLSVISEGTVKEFFVNTYISAKTGLKPTISCLFRPKVLSTTTGGLNEILADCGEGILVTGFNGGNSNPTTGSFSFGVEGFLFRDGKIVHPVHESVITGNMLTLWNNLVAAGSDYRPCTSFQVPTLAFTDVDFSG